MADSDGGLPVPEEFWDIIKNAKPGDVLTGAPILRSNPFDVIDEYARQTPTPPDCPMCAMIAHKRRFEAETGLKVYRMVLACPAHPDSGALVFADGTVPFMRGTDTPVEVRS